MQSLGIFEKFSLFGFDLQKGDEVLNLGFYAVVVDINEDLILKEGQEPYPEVLIISLMEKDDEAPDGVSIVDTYEIYIQNEYEVLRSIPLASDEAPHEASVHEEDPFPYYEIVGNAG